MSNWDSQQYSWGSPFANWDDDLVASGSIVGGVLPLSDKYEKTTLSNRDEKASLPI